MSLPLNELVTAERLSVPVNLPSGIAKGQFSIYRQA
jgi:hypothetical protein